MNQLQITENDISDIPAGDWRETAPAYIKHCGIAVYGSYEESYLLVLAAILSKYRNERKKSKYVNIELFELGKCSSASFMFSTKHATPDTRGKMLDFANRIEELYRRSTTTVQAPLPKPAPKKLHLSVQDLGGMPNVENIDDFSSETAINYIRSFGYEVVGARDTSRLIYLAALCSRSRCAPTPKNFAKKVNRYSKRFGIWLSHGIKREAIIEDWEKLPILTKAEFYGALVYVASVYSERKTQVRRRPDDFTAKDFANLPKITGGFSGYSAMKYLQEQHYELCGDLDGYRMIYLAVMHSKYSGGFGVEVKKHIGKYGLSVLAHRVQFSPFDDLSAETKEELYAALNTLSVLYGQWA
jgi:hypothetical protein